MHELKENKMGDSIKFENVLEQYIEEKSLISEEYMKYKENFSVLSSNDFSGLKNESKFEEDEKFLKINELEMKNFQIEEELKMKLEDLEKDKRKINEEKIEYLNQYEYELKQQKENYANLLNENKIIKDTLKKCQEIKEDLLSNNVKMSENYENEILKLKIIKNKNASLQEKNDRLMNQFFNANEEIKLK